MNFPAFVDKENIDILLDEEYDLRYYLQIPLQHKLVLPKKSVLAILKNPSAAKINHDTGIYESDPTVDRVLRYFHKNGFTEVVIVNLFARYYTYSASLNDYVDEPELIVGKSNDVHIQGFLESGKFDRIVVAWGGYPMNSNEKMKIIYQKRIREIEKLINNKDAYYVEKMVDKNKFPKHGLTWTLKSPMKEYVNCF